MNRKTPTCSLRDTKALMGFWLDALNDPHLTSFCLLALLIHNFACNQILKFDFALGASWCIQ